MIIQSAFLSFIRHLTYYRLAIVLKTISIYCKIIQPVLIILQQSVKSPHHQIRQSSGVCQLVKQRRADYDKTFVSMNQLKAILMTLYESMLGYVTVADKKYNYKFVEKLSLVDGIRFFQADYLDAISDEHKVELFRTVMDIDEWFYSLAHPKFHPVESEQFDQVNIIYWKKFYLVT